MLILNQRHNFVNKAFLKPYVLYNIHASQKLCHENVEVAISIYSNIDKIKITPLLFITLMNNGFKHDNTNNHNLKIKINCKTINETVLSFEILNNFVLSRLTKTKKGISLINTMKQLKLIFKDQYTFEHKVKFNNYIIALQIPIYNED